MYLDARECVCVHACIRARGCVYVFQRVSCVSYMYFGVFAQVCVCVDVFVSALSRVCVYIIGCVFVWRSFVTHVCVYACACVRE